MFAFVRFFHSFSLLFLLLFIFVRFCLSWIKVDVGILAHRHGKSCENTVYLKLYFLFKIRSKFCHRIGKPVQAHHRQSFSEVSHVFSKQFRRLLKFCYYVRKFWCSVGRCFYVWLFTNVPTMDSIFEDWWYFLFCVGIAVYPYTVWLKTISL